MPRAKQVTLSGPTLEEAKVVKRGQKLRTYQDVVEFAIYVAMHASDSGYDDYANRWEGGREFLPFQPSAFRTMVMGDRAIYDTMASLVIHGLFDRHPTLHVVAIERMDLVESSGDALAIALRAAASFDVLTDGLADASDRGVVALTRSASQCSLGAEHFWRGLLAANPLQDDAENEAPRVSLSVQS